MNKRSGKIHSSTCASVELMSDKNKETTKETLLELLKKEYTICRKCKAGLNKPRNEEIIDNILHDNLYVEDVKIVSTYKDYLNAVNTMGEWYVNHVPTYASKLQTEAFSKYSGDLSHYKEYVLKHKGETNTYIVLSSAEDAQSTGLLSGDALILRGSEKAALNYKDAFDQIDFEKRIAYYPCDLLDQSSDYNKPGDDCVRYLFAVFNIMDNEFTQKYSLLTKTSFSKTNSKNLRQIMKI